MREKLHDPAATPPSRVSNPVFFCSTTGWTIDFAAMRQKKLSLEIAADISQRFIAAPSGKRGALIDHLARKHNVHVATVYRAIQPFRSHRHGGVLARSVATIAAVDAEKAARRSRSHASDLARRAAEAMVDAAEAERTAAALGEVARRQRPCIPPPAQPFPPTARPPMPRRGLEQ